MRTFTFIAWVSLLLGFGAWAGIYFFYETIQEKETARTQRLRSIEQSTQQQTSAARIQALVNDTKDSRAALDAIMTTELLSAVKTVESVGKPLGLVVHVENASPSGSKTGLLHAVSFALSADGSYSSLMRLLQLFETIPLPAIVEQASINKQSDDPKADAPKDAPKALWHLELRLKVLTLANVSS